MSTRVPCLAVGILLIGWASASAQVKDAVELLPAHTLACLELRQPARLSREVAALVKGSMLDDLPRRLGKLSGNGSRVYRFSQQREQLSMLNVFLSPEAINEGGRIGGGFVALTGFAKDNTPEWVGVLQNGSSNFPAIFFRGMVTSSMFPPVGEVEGVSLYREKSYVAPVPVGRGGAPRPAPRQNQKRESGPVMGQLPGLILLGGSVDSLKGVIGRAKHKNTGPSLTNLRAYKESVGLRDRAGLFGYVDVAALEARLDEEGASAEERVAPTWWSNLKTLLGNQTVRSLTFSLTLQHGTLESQTRFQLDDKHDSPLLGLLPDRAAQRELLHFAPNDALLALTGGLGDNEKRWKTFVGLLDALFKLNGGPGDNRPSRVLEEMEKKLDVHISKDVFARMTGAGLVIHKDWRTKSGQMTLLLRATDEKAAAKLEKEGLLRIFSLGDSEMRVPTEEEIQGQRIKTMKDWSGIRLLLPPIHFGRQGAVLVLGFDSELVAESLVLGAKQQGLLAESKVAAAIKEIDEKAVVIGVLSSAQAARELFAVLSRPPTPVIVPKNGGMMPVQPAPPGGAPVPPPPPPPPQAADQPEKSNESPKPAQPVLKEAEPLVFCLKRQPESLVLEIQPLPLRRMTPRLLDAWVETLLKPLAVNGPPAGFLFDGVNR